MRTEPIFEIGEVPYNSHLKILEASYPVDKWMYFVHNTYNGNASGWTTEDELIKQVTKKQLQEQPNEQPNEREMNKPVIDYIEVLEEQNGRAIKDKEELIKQDKALTLTPETIEVVKYALKYVYWNEPALNNKFELNQKLQAQAEFNAVYGGGE